MLFVNELSTCFAQMDASGHQSPAEMETVKKILETVNANVTRQLLEASVQRVKNSGDANPVQVERSYDKADFSEGSITAVIHSSIHSFNVPFVPGTKFGLKKKGLAAKLGENQPPVSPRTTPGLEDMMEEVPDTDDPPIANETADAYGEDATSETGTDDSGLVMALDQDSTEQRDENPSANYSVVSNSTVKSSERTRSTISEDKAAVRARLLSLCLMDRVTDQLAGPLQILKSYFAVQPRPKRDEINRLSLELNFPPRVIQVWFQNARARDRREALYNVNNTHGDFAFRNSSHGSVTENYAQKHVVAALVNELR